MNIPETDIEEYVKYAQSKNVSVEEVWRRLSKLGLAIIAGEGRKDSVFIVRTNGKDKKLVLFKSKEN